MTVLCDTNILIGFYKGKSPTIQALNAIGQDDLSISVITAGELYFGAKDKQELKMIKRHLALLRQIPLDSETSGIFLNLLDTYALSHKLSIPDALIAATALKQKLPLYILNKKDFSFIPGLT